MPNNESTSDWISSHKLQCFSKSQAIMFYLSGRGNVSGNSRIDGEDEFGWYLGDQERIEDKIYNNRDRVVRSSQPKIQANGVKMTIGQSSSLGSSASMLTCTDSEDPENYSIVHDLTRRENADDDNTTDIENIEMNSLKRADDLELDIDMIEQDTDRVFTSSMRSPRDQRDYLSVEVKSEDDGRRAICYTPERLVRTQEYRILTPSPKYFAIPRNTPCVNDDASPRRYRGHRRRLGDLIDAKQFGASHLEALLDPGAPEVRLPVSNRRRLNIRDRCSIKKSIEQESDIESREPLAIANRESPASFQTPDLTSSRSSYERLSASWNASPKNAGRSSQEDTSGVHSNDWSNDTPSDIQTPVCLCDELATASRSFSHVTASRSRGAAINEVVSILENMERDPKRAVLLLEEDRFCEATSGHDHLTRLALTIEPDGAVPPVLGDPENLVDELRRKIERLQETSRDIFDDIGGLRRDFQRNETKVDDLMDGAVNLRQDINEMRYLDDLLSLLDGELERISRRNWPFVMGHSDHRTDEMNLVV